MASRFLQLITNPYRWLLGQEGTQKEICQQNNLASKEATIEEKVGLGLFDCHVAI